MSTFRREVKWVPGHAYRPKYGRGTLQCRMILHGEVGSVEFRWFTGITPEIVDGDWASEWMHRSASGMNIGYHFDTPRDYQTGDDPIIPRDKCDLRPSGYCYWDASYTASDPMLRTFLIDGEEAVWAALEQCYVDWVTTVMSEAAE